MGKKKEGIDRLRLPLTLTQKTRKGEGRRGSIAVVRTVATCCKVEQHSAHAEHDANVSMLQQNHQRLID